MVLLDFPNTPNWFYDMFHQLGLTPNIAYRTASTNMMWGLVANDLGYSIIHTPTKTNQSIDGEYFLLLPISDDLKALRMGIAHVENFQLTKAAQIAI